MALRDQWVLVTGGRFKGVEGPVLGRLVYRNEEGSARLRDRKVKLLWALCIFIIVLIVVVVFIIIVQMDAIDLPSVLLVVALGVYLPWSVMEIRAWGSMDIVTELMEHGLDIKSVMWPKLTHIQLPYQEVVKAKRSQKYVTLYTRRRSVHYGFFVDELGEEGVELLYRLLRGELPAVTSPPPALRIYTSGGTVTQTGEGPGR